MRTDNEGHFSTKTISKKAKQKKTKQNKKKIKFIALSCYTEV